MLKTLNFDEQPDYAYCLTTYIARHMGASCEQSCDVGLHRLRICPWVLKLVIVRGSWKTVPYNPTHCILQEVTTQYQHVPLMSTCRFLLRVFTCTELERVGRSRVCLLSPQQITLQ
jgi:hypothetical protein